MTIHLQSLIHLGGFLSLSGLQQNELGGQQAAQSRGGYMFRLTGKLVPTYVGAALEVGNAWRDSVDIAFDDSILTSSGLFLGADTILGPLYLGYGRAEVGNDALYLFLDKPWSER